MWVEERSRRNEFFDADWMVETHDRTAALRWRERFSLTGAALGPELTAPDRRLLEACPDCTSLMAGGGDQCQAA